MNDFTPNFFLFSEKLTMLWQRKPGRSDRAQCISAALCALDADLKETLMHKTLASLLVAATIAVTLFATATDASAQRGWGWGPGLAIGALTGAVVAGAIIASRPPGYVVYPGYAQPVYAPGCYWASQPVYDGAGRIVSYTGQPVQVCPGYGGPR